MYIYIWQEITLLIAQWAGLGVMRK